jgi:hypothetical protein
MNSTALGFGVGIIIGLILFFVLLSIGWIDKLIEWIDERFR